MDTNNIINFSRTNLPKEVMGYPDFPIPEQHRSYLSQVEILDFLNQYADYFKIRKLIKVNRAFLTVFLINYKFAVQSHGH